MLSELLNIRPGITAVIGGGGKTSLLRALGEELSSAGTVVLATSTRIYPFPGMENVMDPEEAAIREALARDRCVAIGKPAREGKLAAPTLPFLRLAELADYVIVEADGAKRLPFKAHGPGEPVIPEGSGQVILVAGMGAMGKPIREVVHRSGVFAALAGCGTDAILTPALAARVMLAEKLHDRVFLNQCEEGYEAALDLAKYLGCPVAAGSIQKGEYRCLY